MFFAFEAYRYRPGFVDIKSSYGRTLVAIKPAIIYVGMFHGETL
jgi:hypothetical protein